MLIITDLKVSEAEVVVKLGIVLVNSFRLFEGCDGKNEFTLFVHGDAIVKESFPGACMVFLQMLLAHNLQAIPILLVKHVNTDLFECKFLTQIKLFFIVALALLLVFLIFFFA